MTDITMTEITDMIRVAQFYWTKTEAAELAAVIRKHAPSYAAIAATLEEMSNGEMEVLCLQMLDKEKIT